MSATVWNWMIVFEDGAITTLSGETLTNALYDLDRDESDIVAVVRNGW